MLNTVWYVGRPRMGTMSSTDIVALPAFRKLTLAWYSSRSPTLKGTRTGAGGLWLEDRPMRLVRAIQSAGRIRPGEKHFPCRGNDEAALGNDETALGNDETALGNDETSLDTGHSDGIER